MLSGLYNKEREESGENINDMHVHVQYVEYVGRVIILCQSSSFTCTCILLILRSPTFTPVVGVW